MSWEWVSVGCGRLRWPLAHSPRVSVYYWILDLSLTRQHTLRLSALTVNYGLNCVRHVGHVFSHFCSIRSSSSSKYKKGKGLEVKQSCTSVLHPHYELSNHFFLKAKCPQTVKIRATNDRCTSFAVMLMWCSGLRVRTVSEWCLSQRTVQRSRGLWQSITRMQSAHLPSNSAPGGWSCRSLTMRKKTDQYNMTIHKTNCETENERWKFITKLDKHLVETVGKRQLNSFLAMSLWFS